MPKPKAKIAPDIAINDPQESHGKSLIDKIRAHKEGLKGKRSSHKQGLRDNKSAFAKDVQGKRDAHKGKVPKVELPKDDENARQDHNESVAESLRKLQDRIKNLEGVQDDIIANVDAEDDPPKVVKTTTPRREGDPNQEPSGWTYNGPFSLSKVDNTTIRCTGGYAVAGETELSVSQDDLVTAETDATLYIYIELWFNLTWKSNLVISDTRPDQSVENDGGTDYPCFRKIIGTAVVSSSVMADPDQWHTGDVFISGRIVT